MFTVTKSEKINTKKKMNKIRKIQNLGGHIEVGQLYDASTDNRIPGEFLWYRNKTKFIEGDDIFQTKQTHGTSRKLLERLDVLDIDASLKVSFLGGLIEISGSANYLNNQREYQDSYRVSRKFFGEGKDITIDAEMSTVNPHNCARPGATHVVTAVKRGFSAIMTFEVEKSENDKIQNIGGSLNVMVKNLPGFSIEGSANVSLNEDEKTLAEKMTFSYEGDADIRLPGTFEEAVKNWQKIGDIARDNQRVIQFTISPLERYCDQEQKILTEITEGNIVRVGEMIQDFDEIDLLLKSFERRQFTQENEDYKLLILQLIQGFNTERYRIQRKVRDILPKIRKGSSSEQDLTNLLLEYENSPYKFSKVHNLLQKRETEIQLIQKITQKAANLKNVNKIIHGSGEAQSCSFEKTYVVIYDLDVLPEDPKSFVQRYEDAKGLFEEDDKWKMAEELGRNKPLLDGFTNFATVNNGEGTSICFIIRVNEYNNSSATNFKMKLLKHSKVLVEEFLPPGKDKLYYITNVIERGFDHMELRVKHFNVTQLRPVLKAEVTELGVSHKTYFKEMEKNTMETVIKLDSLNPNTLYNIAFKVDLYENEHPALLAQVVLEVLEKLKVLWVISLHYLVRSPII